MSTFGLRRSEMSLLNTNWHWSKLLILDSGKFFVEMWEPVFSNQVASSSIKNQ